LAFRFFPFQPVFMTLYAPLMFAPNPRKAERRIPLASPRVGAPRWNSRGSGRLARILTAT